MWEEDMVLQAKNNIKSLAYRAENCTNETELSKILEIMGYFSNVESIPVLQKYLNHETPIVVESALLALEKQLAKVLEEIVVIRDKSEEEAGISLVATSVLEFLRLKAL